MDTLPKQLIDGQYGTKLCTLYIYTYMVQYWPSIGRSSDLLWKGKITIDKYDKYVDGMLWTFWKIGHNIKYLEIKILRNGFFFHLTKNTHKINFKKNDTL